MIPYHTYLIDPVTFKIYKDGVEQFSLRYFHNLNVAKYAIDKHLRDEAFSRLPNLNVPLPSLGEDEQRNQDEEAFTEWMSDHAGRQLEDMERG